MRSTLAGGTLNFGLPFANAAARLTAVVVLAHPPFWFATATTILYGFNQTPQTFSALLGPSWRSPVKSRIDSGRIIPVE